MHVQTINEIRLQNIRMVQDKDYKCLEVELEFCEIDEEGYDSPKLGNALLSVYDEKWADILEVADEHSGERFNAFESVSFERMWFTEGDWESYPFNIEKLGEHSNNQKFQEHNRELQSQNKVTVYGRIALLRNFTVLESYRNKGYGSAFMGELLQFLASVLHVDFVLLHAHPYMNELPYQKENESDLKEEEKEENKRFVEEKCLQLREYYGRFGFVVTGEPVHNYMVLDLEELMYEELEW